MSKSSRAKKQARRRVVGADLKRTLGSGESPLVIRGTRSKLKSVRKRHRALKGWF